MSIVNTTTPIADTLCTSLSSLQMRLLLQLLLLLLWRLPLLLIWLQLIRPWVLHVVRQLLRRLCQLWDELRSPGGGWVWYGYVSGRQIQLRF